WNSSSRKSSRPPRFLRRWPRHHSTRSRRARAKVARRITLPTGSSHTYLAMAALLVGGSRALRPGILLEHFEGPDAAARRNIGEMGMAGAHHIRPGGATGDSDVLLAVEFPGDRLSDDAGGGLEFPQNLAAVGIDRHELAGEAASKHQAAGGHERAREIR